MTKALLKYEILGPEGSDVRRIFFVHGILGSGRNFAGFARRLLKSRPELGAVLVDLRAHGSSHGFDPPHSIASCALDLAELCAHLGYEPYALSGHSFGGKVVAHYAENYAAALEHLFILDAPLVKPTDAVVNESALRGQVEQVIEVVKGIDLAVPRRENVKDNIITSGLSPGLAAWMTTNLESVPSGFKWRFDLNIIETLLADYRAHDGSTLLTAAPSGIGVHVVHGEKSDRALEKDRELIDANPAITFDILSNAGHWVHADNPVELAAIFERYL